MTEVSNPRAALLENVTLVITVVSGVGMTTKWLDPVISFALWCVGYSIAIAGAYLPAKQAQHGALYLSRREYGLRRI